MDELLKQMAVSSFEGGSGFTFLEFLLSLALSFVLGMAINFV